MAKHYDKAVENLEEALRETKAETAKLEKALAALKSSGNSTGRRGRPPGSSASADKKKPGRKRKEGGRRDQVLNMIKEFPGIRVAEIADMLKMQPSAVSAQVSALNKEGLIKKDGRKISAV